MSASSSSPSSSRALLPAAAHCFQQPRVCALSVSVLYSAAGHRLNLSHQGAPRPKKKRFPITLYLSPCQLKNAERCPYARRSPAKRCSIASRHAWVRKDSHSATIATSTMVMLGQRNRGASTTASERRYDAVRHSFCTPSATASKKVADASITLRS
eukprot:3847130-Rhodomonas_salina.2